METQVRIKKIVYWLYPHYGNRHTMPYGKLKVTDGETTKTCYTKGDTLDDCNRYGCQYITFNRKPYKVCGHISQRETSTKLYLEPIN